MQPDSRQPPPIPATRPRARKLIMAAALIGLAVAALAAVDRMRAPALRPAPPHEPAEALIATPAAPAEEAAQSAPPASQAANASAAASPARAGGNASPEGTYVVQAGAFRTAANAQALQRQLRRAGVKAHLETRVQLGPFKTRAEADRALAHARKLGIAAVLLGPYPANTAGSAATAK